MMKIEIGDLTVYAFLTYHDIASVIEGLADDYLGANEEPLYNHYACEAAYAFAAMWPTNDCPWGRIAQVPAE